MAHVLSGGPAQVTRRLRARWTSWRATPTPRSSTSAPRERSPPLACRTCPPARAAASSSSRSPRSSAACAASCGTLRVSRHRCALFSSSSFVSLTPSNLCARASTAARCCAGRRGGGRGGGCAQVTALEIQALKRINKGTQVLLLDKNGSGPGKTVAKELSRLGFRNVFIVQGGFTQWASSKLQIRRPVSPDPSGPSTRRLGR